jgi:NAD+ synthase (glutamine-hydrolysing)
MILTQDMDMDSQFRFVPAELGFVRVAVASPELRIADVAFNVAEIVATIGAAKAAGCRLVLFPELSLTGYSCGDLFYQDALLDGARRALAAVAAATAGAGMAAVVGLPLEVRGRLYNCAAFFSEGRLYGIVPKSFLPSTNEFYEARWFTPATLGTPETVHIEGEEIPFGPDLLFDVEDLPGCMIGVEICEDLWAVEPPSSGKALAGATMLLNLSASNELLGKVEYRRDLVRQQSARCLAAYLYAGTGSGESTTDTVYAGHSMIAENGSLLAETERFQFATQMAVVDVDIQRLIHERTRNSSYAQAASAPSGFRIIRTRFADLSGWPEPPLLRPNLVRMPFVPADPAQRAHNCREIFAIQSTGLARRLRHTASRKVAIGVSGGLDSTLALLVIVNAFDRLGLERSGIVAVTMPGFGTTARTRGNAERLAEMLGTELRVIPITDAVRQHFKDIGHDETIHDVTYENAQARERTQILMDIANKIGGLVVGTGDLSEAALGWMTFNGDHMSMYHVNAGVPKTLVRYLVEWCADEVFAGKTAEILRDIVATPITPELLPLGDGDKLEQKTEETIGPYLLHDFFLYQTVRHQFRPAKVYFLARQAFGDEYTPETILRWLGTFYRRFFSQQFKRSSMPDGPKVGSVALSPRGDWRMPSDASSALWLAEVEALASEVGRAEGEEQLTQRVR